MTDCSPTTVVGCLLDVSGSMHQALEAERSDERAIERLRAVLSAALKLAQAEQRRDPNALVFVGVFGLDNDNSRSPPVIDLCGVADTLLSGGEDGRTGHERLIALANQNNLEHITQYIRTKLTDEQARIVHVHLRQHRELVEEFVNAIPPPGRVKGLRTASQVGGIGGGMLLGTLVLPIVGTGIGLGLGMLAAHSGAAYVEDRAVDNSEALRLAHRICDEWLLDFTKFVPRRASDVVRLLQQLQDEHPEATGGRGVAENPDDGTLLDTLRRYMYGRTPMRDALTRSLAAFNEHPTAEQRILVLVSDGESTDGDPLPLARKLQQANVTLAAVYLTSDREVPRRRLYDRAAAGWNSGQRTLFNMSARIDGATHPIPVLASMGWEVPSSGECALYTTVCSSAALDEFCSLLLSARFGSADALLDVIGRVRLDTYVDDEHVRTRNNPSDQGQSMTCYAHAIAAVIHMALLRIVGREGGCPSIEQIRTRILQNFPPGPSGQFTEGVLRAATTWYRPLSFRKVDEDGARQAVLHRRPVLTTFRLSNSGWKTFSRHFRTPGTRSSVLTRNHMAPHRSLPDGGGHAVVLISCDPCSLTFLNSWGHQWGKNGSFSVEDHTVLELKGASDKAPVGFYDVYWLESDLTAVERQAYNVKVDEALRVRAGQHPSILQLEARCPLCHANAPIANFTGSIRQAVCPRCSQSFAPEPGHLVQALYMRAGLGDAK